MKSMGSTLLTLKNVSIGYQKINIINEVSLNLKRGQKLGILGRNGVGKTTLMKGTIGLLPTITGTISLEDQEITHMAAFKRSASGLAYVPQGREIFGDLTVKENLQMGAVTYLKKHHNVTLQQQIDQVTTFFPDLIQHMNRKGGVLSGGQQQQLSIARALMSNPKVLLLDEPTDGIQPNVVQKLAATLNQIQKQMGMSLILVEQNLAFSKQIIDDYVIIQKGSIVAQGAVGELTDEITSKYLAV